MNPVPATVRAPRLPQVNLIPPEVGQRRARSRQRAIALLLLLMFVLLMGGLAYWILTLKADAEERLADAEERNADLQAEAASYSEVPVVRSLLANITEARAYAGATDLNFNDFLGQIGAVLPDDVVLDTITISKVGLITNANPPSGPLARPSIGTLTFSGSSPTPIDAAALSDALETALGLEAVRITTSTRALDEGFETDAGDGDVIYLLNGTAQITIEALSDRFAPEDRGEPIDLDADPDAAEPVEEPAADDDAEGDV